MLMKIRPVFRAVTLSALLLIGLVAAQTALMQGGNLLTNPGFEQPFEAVPGHAPSMVAQGWTAWYSEAEPNTAPEYYPASDTINGMATPRIHSGSDAQQYFTFFAAHDGGLYQQVTGLTPGDELRFSTYIYIWASSGDDPNVSDGNGELSVQVGIDPNGGTDPSGGTVVWSTPLAIVDQYVQHSVNATAAAETVTVFIRSNVSKIAMNNVVYLDDAELVVTGTEAVAPVMTEAATEALTEAAVEMTPVVTEAAVSPELPTETEAVTAEATLVVTAESTVPATAEVTAAVTEIMVPTEMPTEVPTEVPPTAVPTEVPPTEIPTEVPPTAVPTEVPPTTVPTEAPPTEIPTEAPPTATPLPSPTLDMAAFPYLLPYTVERGDTVGQLAARFGSTIEAIIIANGLPADARIYVTQNLMIPVVALPSPTVPPTLTPLPSATPLPTATLVPTEAPIVVQPAAETPVIVQPVSPQTGGAHTPIVTTYIVRYGDTLSSIAARLGVSTRELARANNIVNPNVIYVGQVLQVPASPYPTPAASATRVPTSVPADHLYQVMPGDNLYRISVRFNVSLVALIEVNGIKDASHIFVGQILIIP